MPEHFTKTTVAATYWCSKCGAPTEHRVDKGRRGPCLRCIAKLAAARGRVSEKQLEQLTEQGSLFSTPQAPRKDVG